MPSVPDLELGRLRSMTTADKLAAMHALWHQAWSLTAAGVRGRHPDWTAEQIAAEVRQLFLRESP